MIPAFLLTHFGATAAPCSGGALLVFPSWYEYLPGTVDTNGLCTPQITGLNDVWLIVAAVIEILLRIAALAAVGYIIWGGFDYIKSLAEPDKTRRARETIIYAAVGLAIALLSMAIVNAIAGSVS